MREGQNAMRGVVMALGFIGTLVSFIGFLLMLAGARIVLPGIGIIVGGWVVTLVGLLIIAGAVALDARLFDNRFP